MIFFVDTTIRVSVVVLVALIVRWALTGRSAAVRHWALTLGIAGAAAIPLLQLALPTWHVGMGRISPMALVQSHTSDVATTIVFDTAPTAVRQESDSAKPRGDQLPGAPIRTAVIGIWLSGAVVSLSMLAVGLLRLRRVASAGTPLTGRLAAMAADVQSAIGLRRRVALLQTEHPALPLTCGALRPKVLLPSSASQWSDDRARVVLRHELAHIARGDWLTQITAEYLRTVYWFNPLLWIACRWLREDSERACDDAVLSAGVEPADYASHLLELARNAAALRARAALAIARSSGLEGRVSAMLNPRTARHPLRLATRTATLIMFAVVTVPVAIAQNRYWTFTGTVVDQTNRSVPDATLVLTDNVARARYEVRTDETGRFQFRGLTPGEYQLDVQQAGFKNLSKRITVADQDLTGTFELQIGRVQETITVAGDSKESEVDRAAKTGQSHQRAEQMRQRVSEKCAGGATAGGIGGQILPPVKVTHVRPEYPESLKAAGIGGIVTLDALIDTDGTVRDVTVVSSPHPELARLATDAVRRWEFSTTYLNCTPVEVPMRVTVSFVTP